MMNGIVLGVVMLVSSPGVSPAVEASRVTLVPAAFTFALPDDEAMSRSLPPRLLSERSRHAWPRDTVPDAQAAAAKRFSKADRIIAVVAGVCIGWIAGGTIGYRLAQQPRDDDGVSGLKGVVIGAPIGAVAGAVIGYRLTK